MPEVATLVGGEPPTGQGAAATGEASRGTSYRRHRAQLRPRWWPSDVSLSASAEHHFEDILLPIKQRLVEPEGVGSSQHRGRWLERSRPQRRYHNPAGGSRRLPAGVQALQRVQAVVNCHQEAPRLRAVEPRWHPLDLKLRPASRESLVGVVGSRVVTHGGDAGSRAPARPGLDRRLGSTRGRCGGPLSVKLGPHQPAAPHSLATPARTAPTTIDVSRPRRWLQVRIRRAHAPAPRSWRPRRPPGGGSAWPASAQRGTGRAGARPKRSLLGSDPPKPTAKPRESTERRVDDGRSRGRSLIPGLVDQMRGSSWPRRGSGWRRLVRMAPNGVETSSAAWLPASTTFARDHALCPSFRPGPKLAPYPYVIGLFVRRPATGRITPIAPRLDGAVGAEPYQVGAGQCAGRRVRGQRPSRWGRTRDRSPVRPSKCAGAQITPPDCPADAPPGPKYSGRNDQMAQSGGGSGSPLWRLRPGSGSPRDRAPSFINSRTRSRSWRSIIPSTLSSRPL